MKETHNLNHQFLVTHPLGPLGRPGQVSVFSVIRINRASNRNNQLNSPLSLEAVAVAAVFLEIHPRTNKRNKALLNHQLRVRKALSPHNSDV
jgi:hypothetical protein